MKKKLRNKKRKISEVDRDRVPVTKFEEDSENAPSSASTADKSSKQPYVQQTLSQTWSSSTGDPTKLTPARQNKIDYFLLRFIVCCSIASAVLDNGFFWDFVLACKQYIYIYIISSFTDWSNAVYHHIKSQTAPLS